MFWEYDEDEKEVVSKKPDITPSEFIEKAHEAKHDFWALEEDDEAVLLERMDQKQDEFQSSDETGAEERFENRVKTFKQKDKPVYKHHFWWFVHNCIAHPFIGLLPNKLSFDFHDWTSKKINDK